MGNELLWLRRRTHFGWKRTREMMKRLEWLTKRIALVSMFLTGGVASAQTITDFFDDTVLQEIHLDVNPADWASIKANPCFKECFEFPPLLISVLPVCAAASTNAATF